MSAELLGFVSPYWLTFKQALELCGNVKKGEHGSPVVYASTFKKRDTADDGSKTEEDIPFLKEYTVFCVYSYCTIVDLEFRLAGMTGFTPATSTSGLADGRMFISFSCRNPPRLRRTPSFLGDSSITFEPSFRLYRERLDLRPFPKCI